MELTQTEKLLQEVVNRSLRTPADAPDRALVVAESDLAFAIIRAQDALKDAESALLRVTELRTASELRPCPICRCRPDITREELTAKGSELTRSKSSAGSMQEMSLLNLEADVYHNLAILMLWREPATAKGSAGEGGQGKPEAKTAEEWAAYNRHLEGLARKKEGSGEYQMSELLNRLLEESRTVMDIVNRALAPEGEGGQGHSQVQDA